MSSLSSTSTPTRLIEPYGGKLVDLMVPADALADVLRVGRRGIVSFPNLGYHEFRRQLADEGRAPRIGGLRWHETPNLRFLSIADFEEFCAAEGIHIEARVALDTQSDAHVADNPNGNADLAIAVLRR